MVSIAFIVLFHRFIFVSNLSILFFLGLFVVQCSALDFKVFYQREFISVLIIFLISILYWVLREGNVHFDYLDFNEIFKKENLSWRYSVLMISFVVGCLYNYHKKKFSIFKYITSIYLLIFTLRIVSNISEFKYGNNLWAGMLFIVLIPISVLAISEFSNKKKIINFVFLGSTLLLLLISSRFAAICLVGGVASYYFVSRQKLHNKFISLYFGGYIISMFLVMSFYINLTNTGVVKVLNDISIEIFNKSIFSGRNYMWKELIVIIFKELFFGYGTEQNSSFFLSTIKATRNLSSHNIYLELMLRGGGIGLSFFILKLLLIVNVFSKVRTDYLSQMGITSVFMVSLCAFSCEFVITQNLMLNVIIWFFWGVVFRYCLIEGRMDEVST